MQDCVQANGVVGLSLGLGLNVSLRRIGKGHEVMVPTPDYL